MSFIPSVNDLNLKFFIWSLNVVVSTSFLYWPFGLESSYFIFNVLINLTSIFISVIGGIHYKTISTLAAITIIARLCYFLIPATNKSSYDNNKKKFKLLHSLSVISTLIILLLCVSQIFFIVSPTEEILWYEKNDLLNNFRPINSSL